MEIKVFVFDLVVVEGIILFKMCIFFNRDVVSYVIVIFLLLIKLK